MSRLRNKRVVAQLTERFRFETLNEYQDAAWEAMQNNDIIFITGPAGSSKTFCATAFAIDQVLGRQRENIVITRPSVEAGERLGFLPGDGNMKIAPYLQPIFDTIDKLVEKPSNEYNLVKLSVKIRPLAYMRGMTFDNSVAILDEAQNVSSEQMKLWLSRIGKNSKMIVCGDDSQTDLREQSCLLKAAGLLDGMRGFAHVRMPFEAIVRHEIIQPMMTRLAHL